MKYVDIKVTIWNRLIFDDDTDMKEIAEIIRSQGVLFVCDKSFGYRESWPLFETEEFISLDQNFGQPTIEAYENEELVWENSGEEYS